jgi:poly(A) polymerase
MRLLALPRFRGAYDFLLLRCESGEVDGELGKWWTEFQIASEQRRAEMLQADNAPKKRRRRTKKPDASSIQSELPIN